LELPEVYQKKKIPNQEQSKKEEKRIGNPAGHQQKTAFLHSILTCKRTDQVQTLWKESQSGRRKDANKKRGLKKIYPIFM